jgi:hypothetical protein
MYVCHFFSSRAVWRFDNRAIRQQYMKTTCRKLGLRTSYFNSGGKPDGFVQGCIDAHNMYRQKHGAPPLTWNKDLQVRAQAWADQMAATGALDHDMRGISQFKDGENIDYNINATYKPLCQGNPNPKCYHCSETVDSWYNENKNYDYQQAKTANGKTYLHFTQVSDLNKTNLH